MAAFFAEVQFALAVRTRDLAFREMHPQLYQFSNSRGSFLDNCANDIFFAETGSGFEGVADVELEGIFGVVYWKLITSAFGWPRDESCLSEARLKTSLAAGGVTVRYEVSPFEPLTNSLENVYAALTVRPRENRCVNLA